MPSGRLRWGIRMLRPLKAVLLNFRSLAVIAAKRDGYWEEKVGKVRENSLFFRNGLKELGLECLGTTHRRLCRDVVPALQNWRFQSVGRQQRSGSRGGWCAGDARDLARVRFCISAAHETKDLQNALMQSAKLWTH